MDQYKESEMKDTVTITLNGFQEKVEQGATVSSLIKYFNELDKDLIVEHNGRFVYPGEYPKTVVADGDRLEFINPNFGG
ncbi:MAG: sulfur carrier protein ThiS [Thermodesulfobacteriota bacterium]